MAELHTLARPYAKAVFELASEQNRYAEWSRVLVALAQVMRDPRIAALAGHPTLGRGAFATLLIEALGERLDNAARNFVRLLAENNRLKIAPAIAEEYERLRAEAERRVEVEVVSAAPVQPAEQEALATAIKRRLARDVHITWKTDENLLAGALIRAGDLVIDGSMRGGLERLRHTLASQ